MLRALGPIKRRGRLPRQQQPDMIRLEYFKAIVELAVEPMRRAVEAELPQLLALLPARADAGEDDKSRRARELIDRAAARAARAAEPRALRAVAEKFGRRTSDFQRAQLDRQVRAAIGVPLASVERPIVDKLEGFAAVNVDLIQNIPERYHDRLRQQVLAAVEKGTNVDAFTRQIAREYDVAKSDARRIARDQVGKLMGQLNEERQKALGVTGYIWRTVNDERVRDEHSDREGQHFEWDDPPEDGHPGEPIQCRCSAEPDFSAILSGVLEED